MPKARAPLDYDRYQTLKAEGRTLRQIAQELGIPVSTLHDNLKAMQKAQASHGLPQEAQGPPPGDNGTRTPKVSLGPPQPDQAETAALAGRTPPALHPGGPEDIQDGPLPKVDPGGPFAPLAAQDLADLRALLAWWRDRQRQAENADAPERQLERQTYHIEKRWIEAVRREADLSGDSYAAVVNRAFAQYFQGKST